MTRKCSKCGNAASAAASKLSRQRDQERRRARITVPRWSPPREIFIPGARCLACMSVTFGVQCRCRYASAVQVAS
jgi:hypothetical protein